MEKVISAFISSSIPILSKLLSCVCLLFPPPCSLVKALSRSAYYFLLHSNQLQVIDIFASDFLLHADLLKSPCNTHVNLYRMSNEELASMLNLPVNLLRYQNVVDLPYVNWELFLHLGRLGVAT
jgi:hypothetical protein